MFEETRLHRALVVAERGRLEDGSWRFLERFGEFRARIFVYQMRRDAVRTGVRRGATVRSGIGQRLVTILDGRIIDHRRPAERAGRILQIAQRWILG